MCGHTMIFSRRMKANLSGRDYSMEVGREQKRRGVDFTEGNIVAGLVRFSIPLMIGNLLQQFYNIADTLIVGRFLGREALAAVGSAYTIMVFLTSVILGLCMGSSAFLSIQYGKKDREAFGCGNFMAFFLIGGFAILLNVAVYLGMDAILVLLQIPSDVYGMMRSYVTVIYGGMMATFLYNYFANSLRAVGNSMIPLLFLGVSAVLNVALDVLFVAVFNFGISGAAAATVIAQYVSGLGIWMYAWKKVPLLRFGREQRYFRKDILKSILSLSLLTSMQQSIMNFGILMVQGLVNSFGTAVMAAFAAAVKIDTFAYSPVQDFGNAFSTFVAQNHGAGKAGGRREEGGARRVCVRHGGQRAGGSVFRRADADFYDGCGDYRDRDFLSAHRGSFLRIDRIAVFVLWVFPRRGAAHGFCDPDGHIAGEQSDPGICAVGNRGSRLPGNLAEYSDRLGACGCGGSVFFEKGKEREVGVHGSEKVFGGIAHSGAVKGYDKAQLYVGRQA